MNKQTIYFAVKIAEKLTHTDKTYKNIQCNIVDNNDLGKLLLIFENLYMTSQRSDKPIIFKISRYFFSKFMNN